MSHETVVPEALLDPAGVVLGVEAAPGAARRRLFEHWAAELERRGKHALVLSCDVEAFGMWAGLNTWLEALLPRLEATAPDLAQRFAPEIVTILPRQRKRYGTRRQTLTDVSVGAESVRNYARDRAYRIGHGVIDLLDAWHERSGGGPWYVLADDFDRVGALVLRFFRELARRRGARLALHLVLGLDPGGAQRAGAAIGGALPYRTVALDLPAEGATPLDPVAARREAEALEPRALQDPIEAEVYIPRIIRLWQQSDQPRRALRWQAMLLNLYNHFGFYEDARRYVDPVRAGIDEVQEQDPFFTRWNVVGSLFGCLVPVGEVELAHRIMKTEAYERVTDPGDLARANYVMAMLHTRYLPEKDMALGEEHLERAMRLLDEAASMTARDRHFLRVFLLNGMALVRHRQGRPEEAVRLCREGFADLDRHLDPNEHKLHRSVLLYNQAQVFVATGAYEEALASFAGAMAMDPNYSEYYNERGAVYLALGQHTEALRDFHDAIESSSPYPEVWTNMGQCYRAMGHAEDAVAAYSRALDLDPQTQLAWLGRAECLDALGQKDAALADYDALLALNPRQPLVLANRATLQYERGDLEASLRDLDAALALAPDEASLYPNRAVALADLRRPEEAARDLRTHLRLSPQAEDRAEVEQRLHALAGA